MEQEQAFKLAVKLALKRTKQEAEAYREPYPAPFLEKIEPARRMNRAGHTIYAFCLSCRNPRAQCDTDGCENEAYIWWPTGGFDGVPAEAIYACEGHKYDACDIPAEHRDEDGEVLDEFIHLYDDWVAYYPGSREQCKACDFPY